MRFWLALGVCAALSCPAYAADTLKDSVAALGKCIDANTPAACREQVTASSVSLFDRFVGYGLVRCLPAQLTYISHKQTGDMAIVRARATEKQEDKRLRLVFAREEEQWKLDIPESLALGIGKNWQQQVDFAEKLYVMLKQQMGDALTCDAVKTIAPKASASKS